MVKVHRASYVGSRTAFCSFIMYRTSTVHRLDHLVSLHEVDSMTGLVAHAPDDHRRMVEVTLNHTLHPFKMCMLVAFIMRKRLLSITHTMRLVVRLIDHIDTISVTK